MSARQWNFFFFFKAMTGLERKFRYVGMLYFSPVYANYDRLIFTSFNLGADTRSVLIQRFLNVQNKSYAKTCCNSARTFS